MITRLQGQQLSEDWPSLFNKCLPTGMSCLVRSYRFSEWSAGRGCHITICQLLYITPSITPLTQAGYRSQEIWLLLYLLFLQGRVSLSPRQALLIVAATGAGVCTVADCHGACRVGGCWDLASKVGRKWAERNKADKPYVHALSHFPLFEREFPFRDSEQNKYSSVAHRSTISSVVQHVTQPFRTLCCLGFFVALLSGYDSFLLPQAYLWKPFTRRSFLLYSFCFGLVIKPRPQYWYIFTYAPITVHCTS